MVLTLGIDPDTKNTGMALVLDQKLVWAGIATYTRGRPAMDRATGMAEAIQEHIRTLLHHYKIDRAAVEWQKLTVGRRGADVTRPNSILEVAAVSGSALASCIALGIDTHPFLPLAWAGSIPKEVRQRRQMTNMGLTAEDLNEFSISEKDHTHVIDAIGIAAWLNRKSP